MRSLRKGLFCLAVFGLTVAAITLLVERRIGQRLPGIVAGVIAAAIVTNGAAHLLRAARYVGELRLILRGRAGREPEEGKRFAAIGPITSSGGARLVSPLTQTPAVAYSYSIATSDGETWRGRAMLPASIRCGASSIRLLAFPELTPFQRDVFGGGHAEEYLRRTSFRPEEGASVSDRDAVPAQMMREDFGPPVRNPSLEHATLKEAVVRPDEVVCAFGIYSAGQSGLLLDPERGLILERGDRIQLLLQRLSAMSSGLMNAAGNVAVIAILMVAMWTIVPLDAEGLGHFSWVEIGLESLIEDGLRTPLVEAGVPLQRVRPEASLPAGEARGRIWSGAGDVEVTRATAHWETGHLGVTFHDRRGAAAAAITIAPGGSLSSLRLFSEAIGEGEGRRARLLLSDRGNSEMAGKLTWVRNRTAACHVVFRVALPRGDTQ